MMCRTSSVKRNAPVAALACAVLAFSTNAFGAASSSATLTNFRITLSDMDLNDGITPGITFGSGVLSYASAQVLQYAAPSASDNKGRFGAGPFAPASASASLARAQATANVSGDGTWTGLASSAQGSAIGGPAGETSDYSAYGNAPNNYVSFTMTANTAVTFTAYATATASVTVGSGERASAYADLAVYSDYPIDLDTMTQSAYFLGAPASSQTKTGDIFVTLQNPGQTELVGYLLSGTGASGSSIAPIPEPTSLALMLAGVGVIGAAARRRIAREAASAASR